MGNRTSELSVRIREVFLDGKWIANTNYQDQLEKVEYGKAIQSVKGLNSIALLTYHINYYLSGVLMALKTGILSIHDQHSFQMPDIKNEEDWMHMKIEFYRNAQAMVDWVALLPDEQLDQPFVHEKYGSLQRNLEGVVEHSYYHLGQLVWMAKLTVVSGDN